MGASFVTQAPGPGAGAAPLQGPPAMAVPPARGGAHPRFEMVFLTGADSVDGRRSGGGAAMTGAPAQPDAAPQGLTDPADPVADVETLSGPSGPLQEPPAPADGPAIRPGAARPDQAEAPRARPGPEAAEGPRPEARAEAGAPRGRVAHGFPAPSDAAAERTEAGQALGSVPPSSASAVAQTAPDPNRGAGNRPSDAAPERTAAGQGLGSVPPPSASALAQTAPDPDHGAGNRPESAARSARPEAAVSPDEGISGGPAGNGADRDARASLSAPAGQPPRAALPAAIGPAPGAAGQTRSLSRAQEPVPGKAQSVGPGMALLETAPPGPGAGLAPNAPVVAQGRASISADMAETGRAPVRDTPPRPGMPQPIVTETPLSVTARPEAALATAEPLAAPEARTPPPPGPIGSAPGQAPLPRWDLPQAIAYQIALTARRSGSGERSVELELSPQELGRVRMKLIPGDGIMTVNLMVDRPETLDLMRRHGESLERALHEIGYRDTAFSFADGRPETSGQSPQNSAATPAESDTPPAPQSVHVIERSDRAAALSGDRLDLLI